MKALAVCALARMRAGLMHPMDDHILWQDLSSEKKRGSPGNDADFPTHLYEPKTGARDCMRACAHPNFSSSPQSAQKVAGLVNTAQGLLLLVPCHGISAACVSTSTFYLYPLTQLGSGSLTGFRFTCLPPFPRCRGWGALCYL